MDTDAVLAAVSKVRGLSPKHPIEFRVVDDAAFDAQARAEARRLHGDGDAKAGQAEAHSYFLAFYSVVLKTVFLRERPPSWAAQLDARYVVAHELAHALQDQYFNLEQLDREKEPDARSAHWALIEGDAEATAMGAHALLSGLPPKRTIVRRTSGSDALSDRLLDPRMAGVSVDQRESLLFRYRDGASFVGALVRTGGFALINEVFRAPPSSTAEILHPERYVRGQARTEVLSLGIPRGFTATGEQSTMGELGLRVTLTKKGVDAAVANELAAGWRGDRFVKVTDASGAQGVAWAIVCADDVVAQKIQKVLASDDWVAARRGRVVGASLAMGDSNASRLAGAMTRIVVPTKRTIFPLSVREIAPLPASPVKAVKLAGGVSSGAYRNGNLGLSFDVPTGLTLATTMRREGTVDAFGGDGEALGLTVVEGRATQAVLRTLESATISGMKRKAGEPGGEEHAPVATGYGPVDALRVRFPATGMRARIAIIPICEKQASLMVASLVRETASAERAIDGVLATLDPSTINTSPYCKAAIEEQTSDLP